MTTKRGAIGRFVDDWRALLALPDDALIWSPGGWEDRADKMKALLRMNVHLKISRKCSWYGRGRKWEQRYQADQLSDPHQLSVTRQRGMTT